jgi:hypothetical protein
MAKQNMKLLDYVNSLPEIKAGKMELLGAFIHYMEHTKKIVFATKEEFNQYFKEFKTT